jgi:hypothetical protein
MLIECPASNEIYFVNPTVMYLFEEAEVGDLIQRLRGKLIPL